MSTQRQHVHTPSTYKVERPHQMSNNEWTSGILIVDRGGYEIRIDLYGPTQASVTPTPVSHFNE